MIKEQKSLDESPQSKTIKARNFVQKKSKDLLNDGKSDSSGLNNTLKSSLIEFEVQSPKKVQSGQVKQNFSLALNNTSNMSDN